MDLEDYFHRHLISRNKDTKLIRSPYFLPPMLVLQQSKKAVSCISKLRLPLWKSKALLTKSLESQKRLGVSGQSWQKCLVQVLHLSHRENRPSLWRKRKKSLSLLTKLKSKSILSNNSLNSSRFKSN